MPLLVVVCIHSVVNCEKIINNDGAASPAWRLTELPRTAPRGEPPKAGAEKAGAAAPRDDRMLTLAAACGDHQRAIRGAMVKGVPKIGTAFDPSAFPGNP